MRWLSKNPDEYDYGTWRPSPAAARWFVAGPGVLAVGAWAFAIVRGVPWTSPLLIFAATGATVTAFRRVMRRWRHQ